MSDSEGEDRPSFAVPKYKKNYIEFEAQLNAYVMYKGSQLAFKPNQSADYFPQGDFFQGSRASEEVNERRSKRTSDPTVEGDQLYTLITSNTNFIDHHNAFWT